MRFRGTCVLIVVCLGCLAATACGGESEPVDYTGTWIYTDKVTDTSCTVTVAGSADAYTARFSFETPNGPWKLNVSDGALEEGELRFGALGYDDPYVSIDNPGESQVWCYIKRGTNEIHFYADKKE